MAAGDREGLERLLRYCARSALSLERLRETQDGRYAYELKYPSLGRTHLVLTPSELLARLSLLVAPQRYPLVPAFAAIEVSGEEGIRVVAEMVEVLG